MGTPKEYIELRRATINKMPETPEELWYYIFVHLGYKIPYKKVCRHHDAPFTFLSDAFFEKERSILLVAPRGGGKTRMLSILHFLNSKFKSKCHTAHMGAIEIQAKRCYRYLQEMILRPEFRGDVSGKSLISQTLYKNGSEVEILSGTIAQASGPHPQKACIDEVDLLPWEVYQHFVLTPESRGGIAGQVIAGSTQKDDMGTISRMLKEEKDIRIYRYCWLEMVERCRRDDCGACHLKEVCGDRGQAAKRADGYKRIEDIEEIFRKVDEYTWNVQMECGNPRAISGAVYYRFSEDNVLNSIEPVDRTRKIIWTIDFNVDPMCSAIIQEDGMRTVVKDEIVIRNSSTIEACDEFYERYLSRDRNLHVDIYGDATSMRRQTLVGKSDWEMIRWKFRNFPNVKIKIRKGDANPYVNDRVNAFNILLRDNCQAARLFFNPNCTMSIDDCREVKYKPGTKIIDKSQQDRTHMTDAIGYYICKRLSKVIPSIQGGGDRLLTAYIPPRISMDYK